jgi:hypothetical protein
VACPSEKSAIVTSLKELKGEALEEAGKWITVAN